MTLCLYIELCKVEGSLIYINNEAEKIQKPFFASGAVQISFYSLSQTIIPDFKIDHIYTKR